MVLLREGLGDADVLLLDKLDGFVEKERFYVCYCLVERCLNLVHLLVQESLGIFTIHPSVPRLP